MADNLNIKDGESTSQILRTTETGGVHTPHHIIDTMPGVNIDTLPGLEYLGHERIVPNGSAVAATLPAGTNAVLMFAENDTVRYQINDTASATSTHIPVDDQRFIPVLSNLTSLSVYAAAGTAAIHLLYFEE
jgi:hypothetical protein